MILCDHSEPEDIVKLLQQSVPVSIMPLNQTKRSDYYFGGEDGKTRQFGRVQAGELLANIDSMEDELRRYYENADENYQIIEGLISASPLSRKTKVFSGVSVRRQARPTTLFTYKVADTGFIYDGHDWNVSAAMYYAWIFRLSQAGIVTFYTENYIGTARLLTAIYNNCQKPPEEHDTLNRYYIPPMDTDEHDKEGKKVHIREQNPFIKTLMTLSLIYQLNIGTDKATKIARHYNNILDIAMSNVGELCEVEGIGKKTAEKLLAAIGREVE